MKATIEYNLPEDKVEFDCAIDGVKWMSAMWDLDQWLRSQTKYAPDTMSSDTHKAFEECREKLHEILNEEELKL
jgi:hypothetical protein